MLPVILVMAVLVAACGAGDGSSADVSPSLQQTQSPAENAGPDQAQELAEGPGATEAVDVPVSGGLDACTLVTKAEAEGVLGKPVGEPLREEYPSFYSCKYEAADRDNVTVSVLEFPDAQQAADAYQMEIDINSYPEVSGIGDRALRPWPFMDISVLSSKYDLSIDVVNGSDEMPQFEAARGLAQKALGRLP
jgi:hypothetical protein